MNASAMGCEAKALRRILRDEAHGLTGHSLK
jgi:hypothetical protein